MHKKKKQIKRKNLKNLNNNNNNNNFRVLIIKFNNLNSYRHTIFEGKRTFKESSQLYNLIYIIL
jgi:hypothetical protein